MIEKQELQRSLSGMVDFKTRTILSKSFIENTTDPLTGQPYFDVFWGNPLEMWHDWPDFGDLTARYWEAGYMIKDIFGDFPANQDRLQELLFSYFESDGLSYRPETLYSTKSAEIFDQGRVLYALCSAYSATHDDLFADASIRLTDGLISLCENQDGYRYIPGSQWSGGSWKNVFFDCGYFVGPLIRPLMKVFDLTGYRPAKDLAVDLAKYVFEKTSVFGPNGEFDDHCHSRLATAAGLVVAGKESGRSEWIEKAKKVWDFAYKKSGAAGFVPEYLGTHGGVFRSETCAIMDYLDLTLLLASEGDSNKWQAAERVVRNHLIESQVSHTNWSPKTVAGMRDDLSISDRVAQRMLGAFAGWSAFNQLFGLTPVFNPKWCQTKEAGFHYLNRPRLFQNCCGPAGLRALYLAWSQTITFNNNELKVNLFFNRRTPEADLHVNSDDFNQVIQIKIVIKKNCDLKIRIPQWISSDNIYALLNKISIDAETKQKQLGIKDLKAGDILEIDFPYEQQTEEYTIQHGAYPFETYALYFKGDSILKIEKLEGGLTEKERSNVSVLPNCYPLYERDGDSLYGNESEQVCSPANVNWF